MTLSQLDGIGMPEEKARVEVSANPLELVSSAFQLWLGFAEKNFPNCTALGDKSALDSLLEEAVRLLSPHQRILPDVIGNEYLELSRHISASVFLYTGLFFSALMNVGDACRNFVVPKDAPPTQYHGYRLKKGVLVVHEDIAQIAEMAEGGNVTSYGKCVSFADNSADGVFVNRGSARIFASRSQGGIYVNQGNADQMACFAEGGIHLNHCSIKEKFGNWATDGLFIDYKNTPIEYAAAGGIFIGTPKVKSISSTAMPKSFTPEQLVSHPELSRLVGELCKATKDDVDGKHVEDIAACIKKFIY